MRHASTHREHSWPMVPTRACSESRIAKAAPELDRNPELSYCGPSMAIQLIPHVRHYLNHPNSYDGSLVPPRSWHNSKFDADHWEILAILSRRPISYCWVANHARSPSLSCRHRRYRAEPCTHCRSWHSGSSRLHELANSGSPTIETACYPQSRCRAFHRR